MNPKTFLNDIFSKCNEPGAWVLKSFVLKKAHENGGNNFVEKVQSEIRQALEFELIYCNEENPDRLLLTESGFQKFCQ